MMAMKQIFVNGAGYKLFYLSLKQLGISEFGRGHGLCRPVDYEDWWIVIWILALHMPYPSRIHLYLIFLPLF